jgi:hypothetical protein
MNSVDKQLMTVEDANKRLPLVRAIVTDITKLAKELSDRRGRFDDESGSGGDHESRRENKLSRHMERLEDLIDELNQIDVELKDPILGHVDFSALLGGRRVSLCWVLGEGEVGHWHETDESLDDRRSLLETAN